jgi:alcohol dehydrogenase
MADNRESLPRFGGVFPQALDSAAALSAVNGDQRIVNTLCPGGKERMRRLMKLVRNNRVDVKALLTHTFPLKDIVKAYKYFEQRSDEVVRVAIKP